MAVRRQLRASRAPSTWCRLWPMGLAWAVISSVPWSARFVLVSSPGPKPFSLTDQDVLGHYLNADFSSWPRSILKPPESWSLTIRTLLVTRRTCPLWIHAHPDTVFIWTSGQRYHYWPLYPLTSQNVQHWPLTAPILNVSPILYLL